MIGARIFAVVAASALVASCAEERKPQQEAQASAGATSPAQPAAGKAEQGRFSMKGPGFDVKIDMPGGVPDSGSQEGRNDLFYPGASISGMHIEALQGSGSKPNSGVELRFASADPPARVASWYRDPARAAVFTIRSATREGEAIILSGTEKKDGDPFTLRLAPGSGGGTDGRLTLSDGG